MICAIHGFGCKFLENKHIVLTSITIVVALAALLLLKGLFLAAAIGSITIGICAVIYVIKTSSQKPDHQTDAACTGIDHINAAHRGTQGPASVAGSGKRVEAACPFALPTESAAEMEQNAKDMECQPCEESVSIEQTRRFPPMGPFDTIGKNRPPTNVFEDAEIVERLKVIRRKRLVQVGSSNRLSLDVYYTSHNKAIIQQQATRGCTAAVTGMLIVDNGKEPSIVTLRCRNLGDDGHMQGDIERAGLRCVKSSVDNIADLKQCLRKNGPAIVTMDCEIGGHVVVVDEISEEGLVRLREPYHGWEITVTLQSFQNRWGNKGHILQVLQTGVCQTKEDVHRSEDCEH